MYQILKILMPLFIHLNLNSVLSSPVDVLEAADLDDEYDTSNANNLDDTINFLSSMLVQPWPFGTGPLLYIEDFLQNDYSSNTPDTALSTPDRTVHGKRSKYYRKYPLKRQNRYSTYYAENRYLCFPSKDDVLRLLVALHESRQGPGGRGKTVQFCNRRRPAKTVFTNIRYMGK